MRDYVREVAATRQVPPDLPAMVGLAVMAAAAARRFEVKMVALEEPLCLWTIVAAEPGERKSSVFSDMMFPLREVEQELVTAAEETVAGAKQLAGAHEVRLKTLRSKVARAGTEDERQEAETALAEAAAETPQIPALPRLTADDATPERLASLMAENDGCIALMSSEGGVFGMMGGRYNDKGGPNLDVYLKGHSGDSLRVDRADGRALWVPRTALTMGLTVQPAVIRDLGKAPGFRDRGLPARGLYALPRSLMGTRFSQDRLIDASKKAAYAWAIRRLLSVAAAAPEEGTYGRHRLRIAGDALAVFRPEADRVERALGPNGHLSDIKDWASKLTAQIARIAAGYHLISAGGGPLEEHLDISAHEIAAAWELGAYLQAHALAAFDLMDEGGEYRQAERILAWIVRQGHQSFSRSECYQAVRRTAGVKRSDDLNTPLEILVAHGHIAEQPSERDGGPGRPRKATYLVNPAVHRGR
jgi:hypothetical protein